MKRRPDKSERHGDGETGRAGCESRRLARCRSFSAGVCRSVVSLAIQRIQCHLSDMTNRTYAKLHPPCLPPLVPSPRPPPPGRSYPSYTTLTRTDIPQRVIVCYRVCARDTCVSEKVARTKETFRRICRASTWLSRTFDLLFFLSRDTSEHKADDM